MLSKTVYFGILIITLLLIGSLIAGCSSTQGAAPAISQTPAVKSPTLTTAAQPTPSVTAPVTLTPSKPANSSPAPATSKILRIDGANLGYPSPYTVSTMGRGYLLVSLIFDTLTWKDSKGVTPLLAKSWTVSSDNKTWTMNLVNNAKFTNGQALTASDVKFSFDYIKAHPNQWVQLGMIQNVTVVDNYTVQIQLTTPYAPFLTDVAGLVPIMPQSIWSNVSDPLKFNTPDALIGSGPFTMTSFDSATGTYIFQANPNYFLGAPVIDKLIYSVNNNANLSLQNGDLDGAQINYNDAIALQNNAKYKVAEGPGLFIVRMYLNFDIPDFNNVIVRQALYTAINRSEIVQKVYNNGCTVGNSGYVCPDSGWYSSNITQYPFNLDKAGQMLDGVAKKDTGGDGIRKYNGKAMQYELLTTSDKMGEAQLITGYFNQIGVKITIKTVDQKTLKSQIQSGTFQIAIDGHGSMGGDPVMLANFTSPSVNTGTTPIVTRQGGTQWSNSQFDTIFVQQLSEMDKAKRQAEVNTLQQILSDNLPTLPLYYQKITYAWNPLTLNGWFFTLEGAGPSVPTVQNKLIFINGTWGK
jgi:peptide/nickel transport system substrate-binding protein